MCNKYPTPERDAEEVINDAIATNELQMGRRERK